MTKVVVTESYLSDIAESIRSKLGVETTYKPSEMADAILDIEGGGGSVTITDEANAAGITCVITTSSEPTPTPDIPLNTQLIDFTKATKDYVIDQNGDAEAVQWYAITDYTPVASGMTFEYTGSYWYYLAVYDSNKNPLNVIHIYLDGTVDPNDSNIAHGTLSGNELPTGSAYVRITGGYNANANVMSLIRTA